MSDRIREAVSAFMDGEADELTVRRLLTQEDATIVRSGWSEYHRQRRIFQGNDLRFENMDVSISVMTALADEPVYSQRDQRVWLKPVAGLAVAASVAAVVVVGAPDWRGVNSEVSQNLAASTPDAASSQIPVSSASSAEQVIVPVSEDTQVPESVYLANSEVPSAPVLHFPQRFNGGIPVSLQTGGSLATDSQQSFMYSMPVQYSSSARAPDIRINGMSQNPVLYKPVSAASYTNFTIPAQK
jgi:sigma-E factor negative regulatory protein RseA